MPYILTSTRDAEATAAFGRCLSEVNESKLDEYQRIQWLLARAWREDQVRNDALARELIDEAIHLIDQTGTASSIAVRVFVGGGMLRVEHGDYSSAVPLLERATRMARQIDNRVHLSAAAAGLAIAHGRLGSFALQFDWANTALGCLRADDWGIIAISAAYEKALALALDDRFTEACAAVRELDHRFAKRRPAWATQAWHLVKADIFALAGNTRSAFAAAANGATGSNQALLLNDFAGLHARWQSLLAMRRGTERATLATLREQAKSLERYHAKDQAEVLAAIAMLEGRAGEDPAGTWRVVETHLERLPRTVTTVMRRLGTLR
jgi:hypothetical protein